MNTSKTLRERFCFFHGRTMRVGHYAEDALSLARAEERAEREGIECKWEPETEPWDGDCPAPDEVWCAIVEHDGAVASLGMIGTSWRGPGPDPYCRVVAAQLFAEVFEKLAKRHRRRFANLAKEVSDLRASAALLFEGSPRSARRHIDRAWWALEGARECLMLAQHAADEGA